MMKGISIDTGVQQQLTRLVAAKGRRCQVGALLVRKLPNGSRVFVLAAVPFKDDDEDDDGHDNDGLGADWASISDVPRGSVEAQVQAVGRTLVGGISVGGIYAVSREPGKLAVEALHRLWPAAGVLVHVSRESSQFTVRVAGLVGAKGSAAGGGGELAVVDVKYQPGVASKLITYHCMVDVGLEFEAPCSSSSPAVEEGGEAGREKTSALAALLAEEDAFFRAFLQATKAEEALLEHAVCFPAAGDDGGEEGRFTKIGPNLARVVEVYTPAFVPASSLLSSSAPSAATKGGSGGEAVRPMQVFGSVGCVACIHEKESDQDGVRALKEDFVRSLRDRVHVLREEAATELEDSGNPAALATDPASLAHALHAPAGGALRLPRRVLLPIDPASFSSMLVADYLLPGEEAGEAVARVQETLGLPVGTLQEKALIFPELEAAVGAVAGGTPHQHQHQHHHHQHHQHDDAAPGTVARTSSLGRISSCNSLAMGRAPSTSSLLLGHLDRGDSYGSMGSLPRAGSAHALAAFGEREEQEQEQEQPVTMDTDEEEEDGDGDDAHVYHVPVADGPVPPVALSSGVGAGGKAQQQGKETTGLSALTSSPQLVICMLVVGLAMVIGAALLHDAKS